MAFISLFEVIGPNMVGPSSSHTAGAVSMALLARKLFPGKIKEVHFTLYGSFAKTYRGHGTDRALMGGMLGFETDDLRIRDSLALAKKAGIDYTFTISEETDGIHPNTADMDILGTKGERLFVRGESLGGGKVKIVKLNNISVDFTGEYSTLIVSQTDKPERLPIRWWNLMKRSPKIYRRRSEKILWFPISCWCSYRRKKDGVQPWNRITGIV